MKYSTKLKLKKCWYRILGILTLFLILLIGGIQGKLFETVLSMILFYAYSPLFEKQYHSKTMYRCSLVSIIVFVIISRTTLEFTASIFLTIVITFTVTCLSYFVKDLLDNTVLLRYYKNKVDKIEHKSIENYTLDELKESLPNIRFDIIEIAYGYWHKPHYLNAIGYARNNHIAVSTLYKYLKIVKDEMENLDKI